MTRTLNAARKILRPEMLSSAAMPYNKHNDDSNIVLDISTPELTGLAVFKDEDGDHHLLFRPGNLSDYEDYRVVDLEAALRLWPVNTFIQTLQAWVDESQNEESFVRALAKDLVRVEELYNMLTKDAFPADVTSPAVVSVLLEVKHPGGSAFFVQAGTQVRPVWVHEAATSDNNLSDLRDMLIRLLEAVPGEAEVTLRQYDGSALDPDLHAAVRNLSLQMESTGTSAPLTSLPVWGQPKVQGVLARYAASTQAEPFVNVVTLIDMKTQGTLDLGVGLHDHNLGLFCNGVPIDVGYPDINAGGKDYSEALSRLQDHLQAQSRTSMEILLGDVDSLKALYAVLTGSAPV